MEASDRQNGSRIEHILYLSDLLETFRVFGLSLKRAVVHELQAPVMSVSDFFMSVSDFFPQHIRLRMLNCGNAKVGSYAVTLRSRWKLLW